jgi:glycosyl hydrolase family 76
MSEASPAPASACALSNVTVFAGPHARGGGRAAVLVGVVALVLALVPARPAGALSTQQPGLFALAQSGARQAREAFRDGAHGVWNGHRNVPLRWYDERLHSHDRYPLATIWGAVPLFESLCAITIADPTPANRRVLDVFAEGVHPPAVAARKGSLSRDAKPPVYMGAESYWDPAVEGFAPYPGDRGAANTWFDDNSWWGIAFVDAYRAVGKRRFLHDAQAAFDFLARRGWDSFTGGLWWNTYHTPAGQKSGEALAAGSLLGGLLAQAWQQAGRAALAAADLRRVKQFLSWGDANFADSDGLYWRTQNDPTPMPYVAGAEIEAKELLCRLAAAGSPYCAQATRLADAAYERFAYRLNMGPQFDVIYLHWMLVYGQQTGDPRWVAMALTFAREAQAHARSSMGLYLKAWDGSDMSAHQAEPDMLRTDAATVELFGWLAADGP